MSELQISVVIPYFEDQRRLNWLLNALAAQDIDPDEFEVVIADDGSAEPPIIPPTPFDCRLVRQERNGFRAAAARNLGADVTTGGVLVFLDGDTIPIATYLRRMRDAVRSGAGPDATGVLAVGARRHVDLSACDDAEVAAWVAGSEEEAPNAVRLNDPQWLADGYERTADLRDAGEEDFRYLISAVMGIDRALFERSGGFDETLTEYGGEDWDLAHRARLLGGDWLHVPDAIAWHDGADFGERDPASARAVKDAESLALAQRITLPSVRGRGVTHAQPDVVVLVTGNHDDAEAYLSAAQLLRDTDAGLWFTERDTVPSALAADSRVHCGTPELEVVNRARFRVGVDQPITLARGLGTLCADGELEMPGLLTIRRTRALNRGTSSPAVRSEHPDVSRARTDRAMEGRLADERERAGQTSE